MRSKLVKILFATVAAFVALCTQAATETVNGIEWKYTVTEEGTAVIGSGEWYVPAVDESTSGAITIPSALGGYPIAGIGDYAFYNCSGLMSVTIPNSVTSIGKRAFWDCSGLKSVTIPDSVTSIGEGAFYNCSGLTSVTIPTGVTHIGSDAFYNCSGLASVTIPNSVTHIGEYAFWDCSGLKSVTIPDSVTSIGEGAFWYCSGLTSVTIPDSVTSIGERAFNGCEGLADEQGFVIIRDVLYYYCGENEAVVIPTGVTHIGEYAFWDCSGLKSVTIPDSVTSIGEDAFFYCSGLTSVTIPDSVISIGEEAFRGCEGLADEQGFVIIRDVLYYYCGENEAVVIPTGVTHIGELAFCDCSGLKSVTIPDSVTSIGEGAFWYCSGLTSVTIPNSVTSIGEDAFCDCYSLTSVTIPNSVTSIGEYAFGYCDSLTNVTIPNSVTNIGDHAFAYSGLQTVNFDGAGDQIEMDVYSAFEETPWLLSGGASPPPANDNFADAITLSGKAGSVEGTNMGASSEEFEDDLRFGTSTVWWKWTAPSSATMQFDTFGSEFDTMLGIYILDDGSLTEVAFNDDDEYGESEYGESRVKFNANAGTTYYIGVSGYNENQGLITLSWQQFGPPENDNFADAITLSGKAGSVEGSNINATSETMDDSFGFGSATVWWKWTAPSSSFMEFDTLGSEFDTMLGIYILDDGTLTEVTFNDDDEYGESEYGESRVKFNANAGTTYYIGISGYSGDQGDIVLNWNVFSDVIPELDESATAEQVAAVLEGSADAKVVANITTAAEYAAYRVWALGLEGVTQQEVKESPNAWLSYALNTATLIAAAPKEEDVAINAFESAANAGAFEFTVKLDGIEVGENALEVNLKKVFDIEGAETLASGGAGFSSDNVEVNAAAPENGNVKFTVTPKMENGEKSDSFFFRVKMK